MREIGVVDFVQIQRSSLKVGEGVDRVYNPEPLQVVDRLLLTPEGIVGVTGNGDELIDVHHEKHPTTRNNGSNSVSFGFVQSYQSIRERFGDQIEDGIGGENIIIAAAEKITPKMLESGLIIESSLDGSRIELQGVKVATPCREFSTFCLQVALCNDDIKATIQFLDNGTRGYYAAVVATNHANVVQPGDKLYVE